MTSFDPKVNSQCGAEVRRSLWPGNWTNPTDPMIRTVPLKQSVTCRRKYEGAQSYCRCRRSLDIGGTSSGSTDSTFCERL